jgi:Flp pilus assembly pilin Flp
VQGTAATPAGRRNGPTKLASEVQHMPLAPRKDDRGQDIAEYALIVAVIVILTIGAIHYFWSAINKMGQ